MIPGCKESRSKQMQQCFNLDLIGRIKMRCEY